MGQWRGGTEGEASAEPEFWLQFIFQLVVFDKPCVS